jgi:AraC-like DNA-binding protein
LNDVSYEAKFGSLFAFVPGTRFEGYSDPDHPLDMYSVRFNPVYVHRVEDEWRTDPPEANAFPLLGMYSLHSPQEIQRLLARMHGVPNKIDELSGLLQKSLLHSIMYAIVHDLHLQEQQNDTSKLVESTVDYLNGHYKENLSIERVAEMTGLSTNHYSKLFKEMIGYSPKDYIIRLRIGHAKEILEVSGGQLKDVSQKVGYPDEFYFSRIFKRVVGVPPSQYAKRAHMVDGK